MVSKDEDARVEMIEGKVDAAGVSSAQRRQLHKTIWSIADELRGAVDGWEFKSYVLGMLFYRYISENLTAYVNAGEEEAGASNFDYSQLDDETAESAREGLVNEKGYFILPSQLFANVVARAPHDENLNETLSAAFRAIEGSAVGTQSEDNMRGLFQDVDVNSPRLGPTVMDRNKKLAAVLQKIAQLPLSVNTESSRTDLFGDAYEYLIHMYAANGGKSGGEFFTPPEVGALLAQIATIGKTSANKVYDPACGSGGLLLAVRRLLGEENVGKGLYGQEINLTIFNLARMNMFLHNVGFNQFDLRLGDTLIHPQHEDDEPFEVIVSNPPYSTKWAGSANPELITDPRFSPAGVLAPKPKADLAFTMHMISWLAENGTAAIVEFPGVLYRVGAEEKIRTYLLDSNYVDAVIQLPPNLFFGTTIATCILVLKKSKPDDSVMFINASELFTRSGNKNTMTPEHQKRVVEALKARESEQYFCAVVHRSDIANREDNLSVSTYVETKSTREEIDIDELNSRINRIVAREQRLREQIDEIVAALTRSGNDAARS